MALGSQKQAVRANLANMGKKVLLVEGVDDWHAFDHLIETVTGALPSYELGHCDNDDGVLDRLTGMTEASRQTQTALGAVLDADTGIHGRIRSLQGRLGSYYAIPDDLPPEGLILPPTAEIDKDRLPILGIWLMPDNQRDGMLEDLLRVAMAPKSELYISSVVDKAKADGMATFRDVERSKAIVKTHIAWQDPNKKNLGEAVGAHFDDLAPACAPFLKWLEALFSQTSG